MSKNPLHNGEENEKVIRNRHAERCQQHSPTVGYLIDCVTPASDIASRQRLRSASRHQLLVPRYQLSSLGRRSFAVAGSTTWNSLSADHGDLTCSDESFRRSLKTFLFANYQCVQRIRGFSTTMRYINQHYLSIYLSVCLSVCLSIYLSIYLSIKRFILCFLTRCPKKQYTKLMAITLSILNGFSKFFHCWKAE